MTKPSTVLESQDTKAEENGLHVILVAPNVAERMGGEALKALQIYEELTRRGIDVHQVTHGRVRDELALRVPDMKVSYVEDDRLTLFLFRVVPLRWFMDPYFMWKARQIVYGLLRDRPRAIVHYTAPISPIVPIFSISGTRVVVGPNNGNINYPPAFRDDEGVKDKVRRLIYSGTLLAQRLFFPGKRRADVILVAGGDRTNRALRKAGCRPERLRETLDSGISNQFGSLPRIRHHGQNLRFVHIGRFVPYKGADLSLRALARTRLPVELDLIGGGPLRESLEALAQDLGIRDRVRFIDWFKSHSQVAEALRQYRAFVFPSLAEANGIVVQEAMMSGLPVICVDWGGPSLLVTPECAVAIKPLSKEHVIDELAGAMDRLAEDGELAERMSIAGRERASSLGFLWADLIENWVAIYREILARKK
jgi:glycosyltransferase involved in cell wall biosynthesis